MQQISTENQNKQYGKNKFGSPYQTTKMAYNIYLEEETPTDFKMLNENKDKDGFAIPQNRKFSRRLNFSQRKPSPDYNNKEDSLQKSLTLSLDFDENMGDDECFMAPPISRRHYEGDCFMTEFAQ